VLLLTPAGVDHRFSSHPVVDRRLSIRSNASIELYAHQALSWARRRRSGWRCGVGGYCGG